MTGGIIPLRWARSSRYGGRLQSESAIFKPGQFSMEIPGQISAEIDSSASLAESKLGVMSRIYRKRGAE